MTVRQYPTDFHVQLYEPDTLRAWLSNAVSDEPSTVSQPSLFRIPSRRKYARIRLIDTGVLTPTRDMLPPRTAEAVPFNLILEPLYLGVLPASVLPIVLFLVPIIVLAGLMVPFINTYLEGIIRTARLETKSVAGRAKAE